MVKPSRIPQTLPDAAYDGHKGQGYQVQVMETYSDDNCKAALRLGTEVIAPATGSPEESSVTLSDFTFSDRGKVISCPHGHASVRTKHKKNRHIAAFKIDHCSNCPVNAGKKHYYLRYKDKVQRIAKRRALKQTEEFKDRYRWRAGSEAAMSEYDRRTGVKQLRVRGFKAVRFCATLKAIGINILRATAVLMAMNAPKKGSGEALQGFYPLFRVLKEQYYACQRVIIHILARLDCYGLCYLKSTA
ncbi:MAG: transposase [Deltaproteobacteria bacterium]|nr:transposase [Deltaproteobacteria bacterium]